MLITEQDLTAQYSFNLEGETAALQVRVKKQEERLSSLQTVASSLRREILDLGVSSRALLAQCVEEMGLCSNLLEGTEGNT